MTCIHVTYFRRPLIIIHAKNITNDFREKHKLLNICSNIKINIICLWQQMYIFRKAWFYLTICSMIQQYHVNFPQNVCCIILINIENVNIWFWKAKSFYLTVMIVRNAIICKHWFCNVWIYFSSWEVNSNSVHLNLGLSCYFFWFKMKNQKWHCISLRLNHWSAPSILVHNWWCWVLILSSMFRDYS